MVLHEEVEEEQVLPEHHKTRPHPHYCYTAMLFLLLGGNAAVVQASKAWVVVVEGAGEHHLFAVLHPWEVMEALHHLSAV